jgi:hypothetical protein
MPTAKHALVVGTSGITVWGLMLNLLTYPDSQEWPKITGLTSRPLLLKDAFLPENDRLKIFSGLDLGAAEHKVVEMLKEVPDIATVCEAPLGYFRCFYLQIYLGCELILQD